MPYSYYEGPSIRFPSLVLTRKGGEFGRAKKGLSGYCLVNNHIQDSADEESGIIPGVRVLLVKTHLFLVVIADERSKGRFTHCVKLKMSHVLTKLAKDFDSIDQPGGLTLDEFWAKYEGKAIPVVLSAYSFAARHRRLRKHSGPNKSLSQDEKSTIGDLRRATAAGLRPKLKVVKE
jgi:hypothetical protein